MSTVITIRVPKSIREAMQRFADRTDWPDYLRNAIAQRLRQLQLEEASRIADRVRAKAKPVPYDSTRAIREDRERDG